MPIFAGQIRFGIHAGQQNIAYADYCSLWQTAESLGYDWASVFDHFLPIFSDPTGSCFDGLTLLSAMAAQTSRLRCGVLVVGVTYRHPAVLANIAATIDHISGGRLELGVGAAWYELEHDQYGITLPPIGQRIGRLDETCTILKSLWSEQRTNFSGRYYVLTDALCEPKPVQAGGIPLWIGGSGERLTLRVVARQAAGWNTFFGPLDAYRHKLSVLADHCREIGRDPADIRKSLIIQALVGETAHEVDDRPRTAGLSSRAAWPGIAGTPDECVEQLLPYLQVGVGDFLIGARAPADLRTLELVARHVAPAIKDRA